MLPDWLISWSHFDSSDPHCAWQGMQHITSSKDHHTSRLVSKLTTPGPKHNICLWIKDFQTDQLQSVGMRPHHSSMLPLSTGAPQGCILGPLLYSIHLSLYTNPQHEHSHNSGGADHWGGQISVQEKGTEANRLALRKQLGTQYR